MSIHSFPCDSALSGSSSLADLLDIVERVGVSSSLKRLPGIIVILPESAFLPPPDTWTDVVLSTHAESGNCTPQQSQPAHEIQLKFDLVQM